MFKLISSIALALLTSSIYAQATNATPAAGDSGIFVQVDDLIISTAEFQQIFASAVRYKYYHGSVPQAELEEFRKKVTDDLITQVLVHKDAVRLGLEPDRKKIDDDVDALSLRLASDPEWESSREQAIPQLIARLEREDLLRRMEARIRDVAQPDIAQVEQYYRQTPEKFTEPERRWVSVILRKVPPYEAEETWLAAKAELTALKQLIEAGEEFAALAKELSDHVSAANGGDLGYLHRGLLEESVQQKIEALEIGQLSEPIRVLEGFTLFRLNGVEPAVLRSFDEVKNRAAGLLYRELQDQAWQSYVEGLRASARIVVKE